jgi:hypothetical protein
MYHHEIIQYLNQCDGISTSSKQNYGSDQVISEILETKATWRLHRTNEIKLMLKGNSHLLTFSPPRLWPWSDSLRDREFW